MGRLRSLVGGPTCAYTRRHVQYALAIGVVAASIPARAQEVFEPIDIEVPVVVFDQSGELGTAESDELDLANLVQSAARGLTTVQEAPAIVTVLTHDEIADRQHQTLEQIIDSVPGWMRLGGIHSQFTLPLSRGQPQAALLLHDSVSLFDPSLNVPTASRVQPVETIKRVELITGPGGVLWGANALLGIINVITKDASDVDGVEANVTVGSGNGDREMFRAYVMAGDPELIGSKVSGFFHASFETYQGPGFEMPAHLISSSLPQPNAPEFYGPLVRGAPPRSYLIDLSGKLTIGKLQLRAQFPFVQRHSPLAFDGGVVRENLPEDTARDPATGELLCPREEPFFDPTDACGDKGRLNRDNEPSFFDRYVVAEYRTRSRDGDIGVSAKAYAIDFVRRIAPLSGGASIPGLLEGGISFESPTEAYRAGVAVDSDATVSRGVRLLFGAETFHEWAPQRDTGSRQGNGIQTDFTTPLDLSALPLPCPRDLDADGNVVFVPRCPLTMQFPASRTVIGTYVDGQWRPVQRLILDAGARLQIAPEALGRQFYDLQPTLAGGLVYELSPAWHTKLNVTQGFRPPIFNNMVSNGEAIQIDGDEDLEVETSTAAQAEINARIWRGERRIRELNFRVDYSYTYLENLIQIIAGRYQNTADRGIHSVEFLGKLYLNGGHRLELSYTWLTVATEDAGHHRGLPEHWANLGAVFQLAERVSATTGLRLIGAMEDPNRMVEYRDHAYDDLGQPVRVDPMTGATTPNIIRVGPSELVLDRLPPIADLTLGVTWEPTRDIAVRATVHNTFNARYYQPDAFFSYEPRLEYLPNPAEDFRAYLSATYRH